MTNNWMIKFGIDINKNLLMYETDCPKIKYNGEDYIIVNFNEEGGAIATIEQWESFAMNPYHLCKDGMIKRFGDIVGNTYDITWLYE